MCPGEILSRRGDRDAESENGGCGLAKLRRCRAAQTMTSVVRGVTGVLFQRRESWVEFES